MTGIERLRAIAGAWDEWGLGGSLTEIADQIERELARQDEPDSTDKDARLLYVTDEEYEAMEWVRDHGGLDHVREEWRSRVPYDRYVRKRLRLIRHIAECETALGRRNSRIEELGHRVSDLMRENAELRRRAMPEGMEWLIEAWPKFEDDAPVKLGDMALIDGDVDMVEAVQIWIHGKPVIYGDNGSQQLEKGERVKRPAPAALAADGETLEVGQTVYALDEDRPYTVEKVEQSRVRVNAGGISFDVWRAPTYLTHQRPVLDADGVPIELGDDLYSVEGSLKLHVSNIDRVNCRIATSAMFALDKWADPSMFTHTKPEIDSWERIEKDARLKPSEYTDRYRVGRFGFESEDMRADLVRRCRALAERERGDK